MVGYAMLIIALAFVALVIYLAIVLHKVAGTVDETKRTLTVLTADVDVTLHKANVLVDDINGKVATIDPLFDAVADLSLSVSDLNNQARVLGKKASNVGSNAAKAGTAATALRLASKLFKSRKKEEE